MGNVLTCLFDKNKDGKVTTDEVVETGKDAVEVGKQVYEAADEAGLIDAAKDALSGDGEDKDKGDKKKKKKKKPK